MDSAGLVSKVFFLWAQPMVRAGFRRPLRKGDAQELPQRLKPRIIHDRFVASWKEEEMSAHTNTCQPSLLKVLWRVLGFDVKLAVVLQFVGVITKFGCVMLVRRLAQLISKGDDQSRKEGLLVATSLCLLNALEGAVAASAGFRLQLAILGLNGCFAKSVLRKGLVLHPEAQEGNKRGDLVNLALSDCNRLFEMSLILMQGSLAPVLLLVGFVLMSVLLGPLVLSAFAISLIASFVLYRVGKLQGASFRSKMTHQGHRLSVLNEFLQSVRFAKYYVLEDHYKTQMMQYRRQEVRHQRRNRLALVSNWFVAAGVPCTILALVLGIHRFVHGSLPAAEDTCALIASVRFMYLPFAFFGEFLGGVNTFLVASARLRNLILLPEIVPAPFLPVSDPAGKVGVEIQNKSFSWSLNPTQAPTLTSISICMPRGELWGIVGEIGSGKSSVLNAILGNILPTSPTSSAAVHACGPSRVYVSQEPMVMNATIKENIMFGCNDRSSNTQKAYEKAIAVAALGPDLQILPAGDATEIGEKGHTMSGGQKSRVALARAAFASTSGGLVLLDDPLAAVDAHVGKELFENCICNAMRNTTRVLVTNQLHFLANPAVSKIIVMSGGQIVEEGTFRELTVDPRSRFSQMADSVGGIQAWSDDNADAIVHGQASISKKDSLPLSKKASLRMSRKMSSLKVSQESSVVNSPTDFSTEIKRMYSDGGGIACPVWHSGTQKELSSQSDTATELIPKETTADGTVNLSTMCFYIKQTQPCAFVFVALMSWCFHLGELIPDLCLAAWQDDAWTLPEDSYVVIWTAALFIGWFSLILSRGGWIFVGERAATKLHDGMLSRVLCCPTSFFDNTPSGQVMNRLGEDQSLVDAVAPIMLEVLFLVGLKGLDQLVLPVIVRPQGAPIVIGVLILFLCAREVHRRSNRETIRWWLVTKTPLYNVFEEALTGAPTIFAFCREQYFFDRFDEALNKNLQWNLSKEACNAWANMRFSFLGAIVVAALSVLMLFWFSGDCLHSAAWRTRYFGESGT